MKHLEAVTKVKLHDNSFREIKRVYDMYEEVAWDSSKIITNPLIHLYPTGDTFNNDGALIGFIDCLLFTLYVFDIKKNTVMKLENRDGLDSFYDAHVQNIRVFKDGSTFVDLRGDYRFGSTQSVTVDRVL